MANPYDQAHELAKAIQESSDFQELKNLQAEIEKEETSKRMFDDFRSMQMELSMKQMQGQEITPEEMEKANKLFETIKLNPTISKLLDAEQKFSKIMEDLNKIVMGPLQELYQN